MEIQDQLVRLISKVESLETEVLLGRYIISSFIRFYLMREPLEAQQAVFNAIMKEARAMAEIDGWLDEFESIFEFEGEDARQFVRKQSMAAPFFF